MNIHKIFNKKLILLFFGGTLIATYFSIPQVQQTGNRIFQMFSTGDFQVIRNFIAEYGPYAALVSAALMILQAIVAPLPAFLITFANANLFGWWQGALLSWSSAMAGAALCFAIARILGRDFAERLTSKTGLAQIDTFFNKYGKHSVLIARLLPFVPFDLVSYAAGLTPISFWSFFVATGLGQLPATIVYSYVGGMLSGGARLLLTSLLILFSLSIIIFLARQVFSKSWRANMNGGDKTEA